MSRDEASKNVGNTSKPCKQTFILSIIAVCIFGLGTVLTPDKNEAYLIYGAGTIVDYCKDNQKVKEIPDKAIDALNRYLDSLVEDKKE